MNHHNKFVYIIHIHLLQDRCYCQPIRRDRVDNKTPIRSELYYAYLMFAIDVRTLMGYLLTDRIRLS